MNRRPRRGLSTDQQRGVYTLTAAIGVFIVAFVLKWGLA
jgi:hypothetical protein